MQQSKKTESFSQRLLNWFAESGRKDLPWQQDKTAYRVWVSEIMLQQTQVSTVIPYYLKFMQTFPTVETLANATEDEVLHHWTGLGYYARARNLQKAAKKVCDEFDGEFPAELSSLISLPGIGRSTAGAILSIAMGQSVSILDGNVKRVLTRYLAISGWPGRKTVETQLWQHADELTPQEHTDKYTQAIMDLGATICTRSKPKCYQCPVQETCLAYAQGSQSEYPHSKPKTTKPVKSTIMILPMWQNQVLIYKRPPSGIWGGLYGFYEVEQQEQLQQMTSLLNLGDTQSRQLESFRHTFSHFHLDIVPVVLHLQSAPVQRVNENETLWYDLTEPQNVGLAAPTKKLFSTLSANL